MGDRGPVRITAVGVTDVGRVRDHNEDNLLLADLTSSSRAAPGQPVSSDLGKRGLLAAVADGMGGAASGELASEMAVESLYAAAAAGKVAKDGSTSALSQELADCLVDANRAIYERAQAESEHRGMGTTMTAALVLGDTLAVAQVGDSRAYLLRKGKLVQITKDQSLISQLIEDGTITEEEAETLGGRNIILQALGVEPDVQVEQRTLEVLDGDVLVLCSDGLTGMVKDEKIESTLAEIEDLSAAGKKLVELANAGGGNDNITVVLLRLSGEGLRAPLSPLAAEKGASSGGGGPSFTLPEIPDERRFRAKHVGILGGALVVLGVIAFLLLPSGGDVTFSFPASGASAKLVAVDGGATTPIHMRAGTKEGTVTGIDPGKYHLVATLPHYDRYTSVLTIRRGSAELKVPMHPLPGSVELVPSMARETATVASAAAVSYQRKVTFTSADGKHLGNVPAGPLAIDVSRPQFQSKTVHEDLDPEGTLRVQLPKLEPIVGVLLIEGAPPGATVNVTDEYGDPVYSGKVTSDGPFKAEVRVGTHSLDVSMSSYETYSRSVTIEKGRTTSVDVSLAPKPGSILVQGQEDASVSVKLGGKLVFRCQIGPKGSYLVSDLSPGKYVVELSTDAWAKTKTVTVHPAETSKVSF